MLLSKITELQDPDILKKNPCMPHDSDPDPVLRLQLDKSTCQAGGGAQDQKIPGFAKNDLGITLQNFVFFII